MFYYFCNIVTKYFLLYSHASCVPITCSSERYLSAFDVKKNLHCGSWNGNSSERKPLQRFSSLPSLITQWTCIRCLLDNNCSSLICAACDASASIAQIDGRKIGARKSKKINPHKENRPKITSGFLPNILPANAGTSRSGNNAKINNTGEFYKYIVIYIIVIYYN